MRSKSVDARLRALHGYHSLTEKQQRHVLRVARDRVGYRASTAAWQDAIIYTAWELYRV